MEKSWFSKMLSELKAQNIFTNPRNLLPGKWQLVEYFTEPETELLHVDEDELQQKKEFLQLSFTQEKAFTPVCNIANTPFTGLAEGSWGLSRGYLTLSSDKEEVKDVKFRYAFHKDELRLLIKNPPEKIEFFGMFRRVNGG